MAQPCGLAALMYMHLRSEVRIAAEAVTVVSIETSASPSLSCMAEAGAGTSATAEPARPAARSALENNEARDCPRRTDIETPFSGPLPPERPPNHAVKPLTAILKARTHSTKRDMS